MVLWVNVLKQEELSSSNQLSLFKVKMKFKIRFTSLFIQSNFPHFPLISSRSSCHSLIILMHTITKPPQLESKVLDFKSKVWSLSLQTHTLKHCFLSLDISSKFLCSSLFPNIYKRLSIFSLNWSHSSKFTILHFL